MLYIKPVLKSYNSVEQHRTLYDFGTGLIYILVIGIQAPSIIIFLPGAAVAGFNNKAGI